MKIFFAVHGYKPAYRMGGPIVSVSSLAEALVRKGHHVRVFTTNANLDEDLAVPTNQPVDVSGVEVWYFKRREFLKEWFPSVPYLSRSSGFVYSPEMASYIASAMKDVDVVHTHLPFIYPTRLAGSTAHKLRKPLFYHQRGVFDPYRLSFRSIKKRLYLRYVELPVLRRAVTLIALTNAEVESYRALGLSNVCRIIPNGIAIPDYPVQPPSPPLLYGEELVIVFLGRLHPLKGADVLLEAFISVAAEYPNARLVLAGPDEFNLEANFRARAVENGLGDRVTFPGLVTGDAKRQLLQRADLFCLPSVGEGFSMAVLEALAHSIPVLLSPGCHFPEVVAAGAGTTVDLLRPDHWAEALRSALSNRARLRAMGKLGRALVEKRYSWDHIADQMLEAYEEGQLRYRVGRQLS